MPVYLKKQRGATKRAPGHGFRQPHFVEFADPERRENARGATICWGNTHLLLRPADSQGMSNALPAFDYQRLDAFKVAREALRLGDALARRLPRGYATLADQLRRALLSAYLGIAEASSRQGGDRLCRFRCARGEACEAAAALEGVLVLNLAPEPEILTLLVLLDRLCAMLTRLAHMGERPCAPVPASQRARER
jgi:four helix bundle protein